MVVGSTEGVIDVTERIREYSGLTGVAQDFGTTAPEYLAARRFFAQVPQPSRLYIGRWAQAATKAVLHGGVLQASEQTMSNFTSVTAGGFSITIDGTPEDITGLNFSGATNLNGVATIISTALNAASSGASCVWDSVQKRFNIISGTTGAPSTIGYTTAPGSGTNISSKIKTSTGLASAPVNGMALETPLAAVQAFANKSRRWYGIEFATATPISTNDSLDIAAYVEGSPQARLFGHTITSTTALDPNDSSDAGSQLKVAGYNRTVTQYSSDPHAVASLFGRAFTVNFEAENTTLTLMFKQEPGVVSEDLSETQAAALRDKNINVFALYENDAAILQYGKMASGIFFDEIHATDWLKNAIETGLWNLLYTHPTKVPQTEEGQHLLITNVSDTLARAVRNGLVAPGVWTGPGFGQLKTNMTLTSGFYVYSAPLSTQAQADREARKAMPIQVAIKLAGAIHSADVLVVVNR